jgi:hypothetical protein
LARILAVQFEHKRVSLWWMTWLIFPKWSGVYSPNRSTHGHPTIGRRFLATAQRLADQYAKEHIVALVDELVLSELGRPEKWLTPSGTQYGHNDEQASTRRAIARAASEVQCARVEPATNVITFGVRVLQHPVDTTRNGYAEQTES